ncbi:MAG: DHH family phosphoesterase [Clostridia bacterium]|nr:DHH family phosphoesterase [Clostridia bacterium]
MVYTEFRSLTDFFIPVAIISKNSTIQWTNKRFDEICNEDVTYNHSVSEYIPGFSINDYVVDDNKNIIKYEIKFNDNSYIVFGDIIYYDENNDDDFYIVTYWYDNTKYDKLKLQHYSESFVSCVIVIDNYDDVMQSTNNADKPQLTAFMEESLDSIAQDANGILNKYEKDRYFLYIQKSYLDKMITDNFTFLEDFKKILAGNKVAPTLSIGIGTDGQTLQQNDVYAYSALDMALGRGGDQVVIKDDDQFRFYGGKTQEVEKRTRVKARVVSQAMREIILDSKQIFIMGHKYADVDVLGSALGLYSIIRSLGKNAKIVMETYNQTVERYLNKYNDLYSNIIVSKPYANEFITPDTLLLVVDTQKYSLVEEPALLDVTKNTIVIDHHRKSTDFIKDSLITYHEPYASSASELITEIIQYISETKLNKSEAEALYAGIFMDTKNFTFKTGVRTFEAASYLKRCGVDTIEVKKLFQINLNTFVKKWAIIEQASTYREKVAIAVCEKNDEDMQTVVAQAADEMLNITNISSSFVICDMGDKIIISARSFGDINVQVITEKLGGGGHMTIAGAQLSDTTTDEVYEKLIKVIDEYLG